MPSIRTRNGASVPPSMGRDATAMGSGATGIQRTAARGQAGARSLGGKSFASIASLGFDLGRGFTLRQEERNKHKTKAQL